RGRRRPRRRPDPHRELRRGGAPPRRARRDADRRRRPRALPREGRGPRPRQRGRRRAATVGQKAAFCGEKFFGACPCAVRLSRYTATLTVRVKGRFTRKGFGRKFPRVSASQSLEGANGEITRPGERGRHRSGETVLSSAILGGLRSRPPQEVHRMVTRKSPAVRIACSAALLVLA